MTNHAREAGESTQPELLILPESGRTPLLALIDGAEREILVKIYTLTDSPVLDALVAAARRGVAVRVILNESRADGTRDNDHAAEHLRERGVSVRWGSARVAATHEKSLVADRKAALVGSFNYAPRYFEATRDFGLITRDPAQVAEIAACFEADWEGAPFEPSGVGGLLWAPGTARRQVAAAMARARHSIHLQHAKLVDSTVLLELMQALRRGVKVRFLCAGAHGLHSWDRPETFASLRILHQAGGKVRRMREPKPHGNLTLVDHRLAQLGSMHFHHVANDHRRELAIETEHAASVAALAARFQADWKAATRYLPPNPIQHGDTDPVDSDIYRT